VPADERERLAARSRLDRAWATFIASGETEGVRPEIARSWRRARELYRVDPALRRAPLLPDGELERRLERDETFEVAAPVLSEFSARLRDGGHALSYLDEEGWMLSIGGDPRIVERLAGVGFCPGASWLESACGTSGPGTAAVERRPVEVVASEHFLEVCHRWTSAGAPVLIEASTEPLGVVALTAPWEASDPQAVVTAAAIASIVAERLRGIRSLREGIIRHAMRAARVSGDALLAVDARGRLLAANDAARRRLAPEGGALPREVREKLVAVLRAVPPSEPEFSLDWPSPTDPSRRLACATVSHAGRAAGALLRLAAPAGPRAARGGSRAPTAPTSRYAFADILGRSEPLLAALRLAQVGARNDLPVVIHGESGTGKELFAHGIHAASGRGGGPFVAVNCGAVPAALVEAEFFGYEAGTFTGASREGKAGKLEEADGGTLFLDEVSELSPQAQIVLLRALQESEVIRVGGVASRRVDVRVIAATNKRLADEAAAGRFRHDLYFRLHVLSVEVPALRERIQDVPILARAFLTEAESKIGRSGLELSDEAVELLARHPWPGNVRELRNVMMRAAAVAAGSRVEARDLQLVDVRGAPPAAPAAPRPERRDGGADEPPRRAGVADPEREELVAALDRCRWHIARTATSLGISRMTLYRRLRKLNITR
jgi:transcriptional regulator of acetoin/glycerol metabolism